MINHLVLAYEKEKAQYWIKKHDKNSSKNSYIFDDDGREIIIHVRGIVDLSNNNFSKLPFKFGSIYGSFFINNCNLMTLMNSPFEVKDNFQACNNPISSLMGSPEYIGGNFNISDCQNLTSFLSGPQKVIGDYISSEAKSLKFLKSLHTKFGRFSHFANNYKLIEAEKYYINFENLYLLQLTYDKFLIVLNEYK